MDQAVWYFGTSVNSELEKVGRKKAKGESTSEAARKRVLAKYLGDDAGPQYADPAALFQSS